MKIYSLKRTQTLPISISDAWQFFSSPANLSRITPAKMNFTIISMSGGDKMFSGQIITYKVTVLPLISVRWVTEITHVIEPSYFVDEQRSGPYAFWHHKHHFKQVPEGVVMTDEVDYALPLGLLGRIAHATFVRAELNGIFDHRYKILENYFRHNI
jgi:ligand-binding SRPBCC domain-containing protein